MRDRILDFEGIHNFRDYGGYAARAGRIKPGLLFRSGQHRDATPPDLARMAGLGIETVIDLRGESERMAAPCPRPDGFSAAIFFADGETAGSALAPHVQASRGVETVDEAHAAMNALYRHMPFRANLVQVFRHYFVRLSGGHGPSLLHCVAGKDRTGLAAALLHTLLGVHEDDVMADFLLTNVAARIEERVAAGTAPVFAYFGGAVDADVAKTLMGVHADYLETALTAIRDAHGTVEAYAEAVLGVTGDELARIEEALLD